MNIWLLIWVFAVVFICGVFLWSTQILFRQKRAWAEFAKKNTLQYTSGALMKSPLVKGVYKGFPLTVYSEEQPTPDQRSRRFRTVIQFELPGGMPVEGVVASPDNHVFAMSLLDLVEKYVPADTSFPETIMIRTRSVAALEPYLTKERMQILQSLMTLKSIHGVFIFDRNATFLRMEMADAMTDPEKLVRFCSKLAEQAAVLAIK